MSDREAYWAGIVLWLLIVAGIVILVLVNLPSNSSNSLSEPSNGLECISNCENFDELLERL